MLLEFGIHVANPKLSRLIVLLLIVACSALTLFGQTNPFPWHDPVTHAPANTGAPNPSTYQGPTFNGPASTWSPNSSLQPQPQNPFTVDMAKEASRYSPPNPYSQPTREQTQWYVNNHPSLWILPASTKDQIVNGNAALEVLNGPYLPNGAPNPFYQNGKVMPNWYLPSTWSSPVMNWQSVQPNGFLPSSLTTSYNPSSAITTYNPSLSNNRYTFNVNRPNFSVSRPPQPATPATETSRDKPTPGANLSSVPLERRAMPQGNSPAGPSPADIARAVENSKRALALSEAAGDKVGQVTNHAALAQLFVQQGNIEQGLVHIGIAEGMVHGLDDPLLQASLLRAKAEAYMPSGGFENATELYHQAIVILKSLGKDNEQAEVQTSLGWAYQSFGDVPKALASYEEARRLFVKAGNTSGEIRVALGAGSLYQSMGEFKKAQDEYIRVAARASDEQFARMMVSVAEMLVASNRPQSAIIRYEKALSLIKSAKDSVLEISILTGIGRCHMVLGSYDTAQQYFDLASAKARENGNRALEAGVIASIGELQYWIAITSPPAVSKVLSLGSSNNPMEFFHQSLLSSGRLSPAAGTLGRPDVYVESSVKPRFSRALRTYNEALSLMRDVGDRIGEIGVLTNMGLVYDAWHKPREALSYYLPALEKMEEFQTSARLDEFRIDLANQSSRLYQRAIELELQQHHMEEAFNLSERSRARSFLDRLGNGRIDLIKNAPTDFSQRQERLRRENISLQRQLAQELAKSGPEVNPETISSIQSRLSAVRREYEESVRDLKISSPEYASFLSIAPLALREVQRKLASDVTVLSYFTTPGMTLAFVVTKNGFHVFRLPVSGAELSMAITSLLDFPGESNDPPPLRSLYSWLIEPVRSRLKTAKLVVAPHGVLNNLPFAALTPDGEHFLNDSFVISYLPSTSVLPYIDASVKPVGNQVLVVANDQEEGTPQLSHAYDEAREVAALWHARLLMGAEATPSILQTTAGDYSILHLIAHIYVEPNHPQFSRIILGQSKEGDGALELNGVLGLDLRKTSLVVLSGCRGQSGNWSRGDDVTALNRAFMYAGAPSVIASLWSVDDDATKQLMIAFYSHLKEGLSKAEALRAAQIDVRRIHRNPFYWAGFVLTGDPGESANSSLVARSAK